MIDRTLNSKKTDGFDLGLILIATLLLYGQSIYFGFVWDDYHLIVNNVTFEQPISWLDFFGSGLWKFSMVGDNGAFYRPLVALSYYLEHQIFGNNPWGYHLVNVCLHLVSIGLLWIFALLLKFSRHERLMSCLLYSLHPVQVSCVAFISCHGDLLVQIFGLLALIFWFKDSKWKWLSFLWMFLAMLSKEAGFVLPMVLVAMDCMIRGRPMKDFKNALPFLIWVPYFVFRIYALESASPSTPSIGDVFQSNGSYRTFLYIGRILFPLTSSQEVELTPPSYYQNILFHLAYIALAIILFFKLKTNSVIKFLVLWFFITTLIIANWINAPIRFSDQLLYVPMVPASMLIVRLMPNTHRIKMLMGVLIVLLGVVAHFQMQPWKSDVLFWENELKFHPKKVGTNLHYANSLKRAGLIKDTCERLYQIADVLKNNDLDNIRMLTYNLGNCYISSKPELAEKYYKESLSVLKTPFWPARNNLIVVLLEQGKFNEAMEQAQTFVDEKPDFYSSWLILGVVHLAKNDISEAIIALEKARELNPNNEYILQKLNEAKSKISK